MLSNLWICFPSFSNQEPTGEFWTLIEMFVSGQHLNPVPLLSQSWEYIYSSTAGVLLQTLLVLIPQYILMKPVLTVLLSYCLLLVAYVTLQIQVKETNRNVTGYINSSTAGVLQQTLLLQTQLVLILKYIKIKPILTFYFQQLMLLWRFK